MVLSLKKKLFDAIAHLSKNDPVSVWLLRSTENMYTFDQFVRPNGEFYRTEVLHKKMKKKTASEFLTNVDEANDEIVNDEQLLTNCFTISSDAAHFTRIKNAC